MDTEIHDTKQLCASVPLKRWVRLIPHVLPPSPLSSPILSKLRPKARCSLALGSKIRHTSQIPFAIPIRDQIEHHLCLWPYADSHLLLKILDIANTWEMVCQKTFHRPPMCREEKWYKYTSISHPSTPLLHLSSLHDQNSKMSGLTFWCVSVLAWRDEFDLHMFFRFLFSFSLKNSGATPHVFSCGALKIVFTQVAPPSSQLRIIQESLVCLSSSPPFQISWNTLRSCICSYKRTSATKISLLPSSMHIVQRRGGTGPCSCRSPKPPYASYQHTKCVQVFTRPSPSLEINQQCSMSSLS